MKTPGELVSLVYTSKREVHLISYNQADNTIKTIQNYGELSSDSEDDSEDDPEDDPVDDPVDDSKDD